MQPVAWPAARWAAWTWTWWGVGISGCQVQQLFLRGVCDRNDLCQPAFIEDGDGVVEGEELGRLGRDHDRRATLGGELPDQRIDLAFGAFIDAARRLVAQQAQRIG